MISAQQIRTFYLQLVTVREDDPFTDGAVIRFSHNGYNYVAIRANRAWYTSSTRGTFVPEVCDYATLLEYLRKDPESVYVAKAWEWVVNSSDVLGE